MTSLLAIPRFDSPLTMHDRISLSRWVSPCRAPGQNSSRCMRAAVSAARAAIPGSITVSPRVHQFQLAHQLVAVDAFQQIAARAHPQGLKQVLLVVVNRQHHDLAVGVALAQHLAQVQAAGALHAHIAQHDVGLQVVDDADRAFGAHRLADHLHPVVERGQHRLESLDDHLVVIDEDKTHRHGNTLRPASARRIRTAAQLVTPIPLMGDAGGVASGHPVGVRAMGQTRPARTFWWDREPPAEADVLRAVIFDADSALADIERDDVPRSGLDRLGDEPVLSQVSGWAW